MTQPVQSTDPVPSEPRVVTPPAAPAAAAPAEPPAPAPAATSPTSGANLPDDAEALKAEVLKLRKEAADANGKARTTAREEAAKAARDELAQTIGKALGLVADEAPDPAKLAEQVAASTAEAKQAKLEVAIYQAAHASNVDAAALLDSRTFLAKVADIDPADTTAIAAAIGEAATANPALVRNTANGVPGFNPAIGSSATGTPEPKDVATQIAEAEKAGDFATAGRLKAAQLTALAQAI
jgi:hypothetical protein